MYQRDGADERRVDRKNVIAGDGKSCNGSIRNEQPSKVHRFFPPSSVLHCRTP